MISTEITEEFDPNHLTYFDTAMFKGDDYRRWIEGFSEISPIVNVLIRSFSGPYDFMLLAGVLSQLDHLYDRLSKDAPKLPSHGRFKDRVKSLIEDWDRSNFIFRKGEIRDDMHTRIKKLRDKVVHDTIIQEAIEHSQIDEVEALMDARMLEASAIFAFTRLLYIAHIMKHVGIDWEQTVSFEGFSDGFRTLDAASTFYSGIGKWTDLV